MADSVRIHQRTPAETSANNGLWDLLRRIAYALHRDGAKRDEARRRQHPRGTSPEETRYSCYKAQAYEAGGQL